MATPAQAGNPIDTDGPDFVESSEVVPKGRFQIEMDFVSERDRRDAVLRRTISIPTLMRYGIDEKVELRLAGAIPMFVKLPAKAASIRPYRDTAI